MFSNILPQVTLKSHTSFDKLPKTKMKNQYFSYKLINKFLYFFDKLKLIPTFKLLFYEDDDCNNNKIKYRGSFSCLNYKESKLLNNISFSKKGNLAKLDKIIILCGVDIVSKNEQKLILNKVVRLISRKI